MYVRVFANLMARIIQSRPTNTIFRRIPPVSSNLWSIRSLRLCFVIFNVVKTRCPTYYGTREVLSFPISRSCSENCRLSSSFVYLSALSPVCEESDFCFFVLFCALRSLPLPDLQRFNRFMLRLSTGITQYCFERDLFSRKLDSEACRKII